MAFKTLIPPSHQFTAHTADDVLQGYVVKAMSITYIPATSAFEATMVVEKCATTSDDAAAVGIAMGSVTSGNVVAIATDGLFSIPAAYAITVGQGVGAPVSDPLSVRAASYTCTGSTNALQFIKAIGTAWTTAASGEQVVFKLKL